MSQETCTTVSTRDIFPFLSLPREIQDLIYKTYYKDTKLTIGFDIPNDLHDCTKDIPVFRGIPSPNIELLNRQIRQDAISFKTVNTPRTVRIVGNTVIPRLVEGFLRQSRYAWILTHIEEVCVVTEGEQFDDSEYWDQLVPRFPNMKRINLQCRGSEIHRTREIYDEDMRYFKEDERAHAELGVYSIRLHFHTDLLRGALRWADMKVVIGVMYEEIEYLDDTDECFSLVMKGEISKGGIWNVFCKMIEGNQQLEWDDVLPQGAVTYEITQASWY